MSLSNLSPMHCCECPVFSPLTFFFFTVPCFFCALVHPSLLSTIAVSAPYSRFLPCFFHLLFSCPCPTSPQRIAVSAPYSCLLLFFFFTVPRFFCALVHPSLLSTIAVSTPYSCFSPCFFHSLFLCPCPTSPQRIAVSALYSRLLLFLFFTVLRFFCAIVHPSLLSTIAVSAPYSRFSLCIFISLSRIMTISCVPFPIAVTSK